MGNIQIRCISSFKHEDKKKKEQVIVMIFIFSTFSDNFTSPCLWVGTSLGSVLVIVLNLPPSGEQRLSQPVIVSPSGKIFFVVI
jgi:syntaxin-binding protein 5